MKRLIIAAVILFAFLGGYVLGKDHRLPIRLLPDAVDLFFDQQLTASLTSQPSVLQAQYVPTPEEIYVPSQGEINKNPNWSALQIEYKALRPSTVSAAITKTGKQWSVCGDPNKKVSVTYHYFPGYYDDYAEIDHVKGK